MGYQGLELGVIGLAVDGDPGAGVDAEVSGAGLFGFGAGNVSMKTAKSGQSKNEHYKIVKIEDSKDIKPE